MDCLVAVVAGGSGADPPGADARNPSLPRPAECPTVPSLPLRSSSAPHPRRARDYSGIFGPQLAFYTAPHDDQPHGSRRRCGRGSRGCDRVLRRTGPGTGGRDNGRGRMGGPARRAGRRPSGHRLRADPGRPRPGRAVDVPHAGGHQQCAEGAGERPRASLASRSSSTPSTTSSTACAPTAPNSWARWRSTRTSTGTATSAAPPASSSGWSRSSAEPPSLGRILGLG